MVAKSIGHFKHSPYIDAVIHRVKCPLCGMPAETECVGIITHELRLMSYYAQTGETVDEVYERLGKKPEKIKNS